MQDLKSRLWAPETGVKSLILEIPASWRGQIKSMAALQSLMEMRMLGLLRDAESPEWEAEYLVTELGNVGLISPSISAKKLANLDKTEVAKLLGQPELWARIQNLIGNPTFPITPSRATEDNEQEYEETTLPEMTNDLTAWL